MMKRRKLPRRQKKDATKKALNDIEMKVQSSNRPNPLKKRDLDGNIVDLSDPTRKPKKDVFDEMDERQI